MYLYQSSSMYQSTPYVTHFFPDYWNLLAGGRFANSMLPIARRGTYNSISPILLAYWQYWHIYKKLFSFFLIEGSNMPFNQQSILISQYPGYYLRNITTSNRLLISSNNIHNYLVSKGL